MKKTISQRGLAKPEVEDKTEMKPRKDPNFRCSK